MLAAEFLFWCVPIICAPYLLFVNPAEICTQSAQSKTTLLIVLPFRESCLMSFIIVIYCMGNCFRHCSKQTTLCLNVFFSRYFQLKTLLSQFRLALLIAWYRGHGVIFKISIMNLQRSNYFINTARNTASQMSEKQKRRWR